MIYPWFTSGFVNIPVIEIKIRSFMVVVILSNSYSTIIIHAVLLLTCSGHISHPRYSQFAIISCNDGGNYSIPFN